MFRRKNVENSDSPKTKTDRPRLQVTPKTLLYFSLGLSAAFALLFLVLAVLQNEIQFFILAASFTISTVLGIFSISKIWQTAEGIKLFLFALVLEISISIFAAVFPSYSGFPYAAIALALGFLLTGVLPKSRVNDWLVGLGLVGAIGAIQLNILAPFTQVINQIFAFIVVGVAVLLVVFVLLLIIGGRIPLTLRIQLIFGALAITLIPLITLSVINNNYLRNSIQSQANQSLQIAGQQTAANIDTFFTRNLDSIASESSLSAIVNYLSLDPLERVDSPEETEIKATFSSLQTKEKVYLPSYGLLNLVGVDVIDTDVNSVGKSERSTDYFNQSVATGAGYVSSVEFTPTSRQSFIFFIHPVLNINKQAIGYLRVRYDARILQSIVQQSVGLIGPRSYPLLVDNNGLRLADGLNPNLVYRTVQALSPDRYSNLVAAGFLPPYLPESIIAIENTDFANAVFNSQILKFFTTNYSSDQNTIQQSGYVTNLTTQPWSVIFLQDQTSLNSALAAQNRLSTTLATLIAAIIGILIAIVANLFTQPIFRLTEAAQKISAGDLNVQAKVTSRDEIGILGNSFNLMTNQLKDFIDTLETRVEERTQQLATQNESLLFRSRQLQTVADVARSIVSSRDLETLLANVTVLISERFDFYHVGIFLIEQNGENAVLRATNSVGGRKMLERQHKLQVGQVGIVGYVTGSGEPRIATDVGQDAVFFNNPDLPETKSEMALPLKVENRIIGALDVQSTASNAFTQEDINLFATLADQVAIAINNNQLYSDTNAALQESEQVHRRYLNQEWSRQSTEINYTNYKYTPDGLMPFEEDLPEIKMVLDSGRPVLRNVKGSGKSQTSKSILAVPIVLRGESIGAIHLQESEQANYVWSQNELNTVQAVADQVAQTLENVRLFEQTILRADRDRKVLEITSKIRSTNDPQEMLQITLEELQKSLGASKAQIVINLPDHTPLSDEQNE
jgi:GAF domain-containing protein/HAMP domain-containing protein